MKNRLEIALESDAKKISIYLTAGYPALDAALYLVPELEKEGVDFIEFGMPYSDPLADGEVIQMTSAKAIQNGMTLNLYFEQVQAIRMKSQMPIVFMGYYNQILQFGVEAFYKKCKHCGIDGLIIPDLPLEEYERFHQNMINDNGLLISFLITPTTSDERVSLIDSFTSGFVYVVSSNSITGNLADTLGQKELFLQKIKKLKTKNKKILGFGIHNEDTVLQAFKYTEGAIIGSAFLKSLSPETYASDAALFIKTLKINKS